MKTNIPCSFSMRILLFFQKQSCTGKAAPLGTSISYTFSVTPIPLESAVCGAHFQHFSLRQKQEWSPEWKVKLWVYPRPPAPHSPSKVWQTKQAQSQVEKSVDSVIFPGYCWLFVAVHSVPPWRPHKSFFRHFSVFGWRGVGMANGSEMVEPPCTFPPSAYLMTFWVCA